MQNNRFLLYGANGYTGQLIAEMAATYGLTPILAGRNAKAIKQMAESLGYSYIIFDLTDQNALYAALEQVTVVLHAAGPFHRTARPMMEACIATGKHYLDITGEINVFENAKQMGAKAMAAGCMLMPGVGFDVVPTDCAALYLKQQLPDAISLKLAFAMLGGSLSHGTATTMAENLGAGGAVRENEKIVPKPIGHKAMWVDFGPRKMFVMCIPWGDVSTAYTTTGIPNIETYAGTAPKNHQILKWQFLYNWLLRTKLIRSLALKKIKQRPAGPGPEQRARGRSLVWGEVRNEHGSVLRVSLSAPEGYTLTAHSSLLIVQKVLSGKFLPGYQTPASVFGADLVLEIPGVTRTQL